MVRGDAVMNRLACKYEDGKLWWRHAGRETWFYKSREEIAGLRDYFAKCDDWFRPRAIELIAQCDAALQAYDAMTEMEDVLS
jgi:hypothetical protein